MQFVTVNHWYMNSQPCASFRRSQTIKASLFFATDGDFANTHQQVSHKPVLHAGTVPRKTKYKGEYKKYISLCLMLQAHADAVAVRAWIRPAHPHRHCCDGPQQHTAERHCLREPCATKHRFQRNTDTTNSVVLQEWIVLLYCPVTTCGPQRHTTGNILFVIKPSL